MNERYIYIVLTKTKSVLAKIIRLYTKDNYSHSSISLDEDIKSMYSFARKYTNNPFIGMFMEENINTGYYGKHKEIPCIIIRKRVSIEEYKKCKEIIEHFNKNKEDYKYNIKGLIYYAIGKPKKVENRYFCSEFVYYVLKESNIINELKNEYEIKPEDLLKIGGDIIYKGDLKKYNKKVCNFEEVI